MDKPTFRRTVRKALKDEATKPTTAKETWTKVSVSIDHGYFKRLQEFYALPWYKRLFKRLPK